MARAKKEVIYTREWCLSMQAINKTYFGTAGSCMVCGRWVKLTKSGRPRKHKYTKVVAK